MNSSLMRVLIGSSSGSGALDLPWQTAGVRNEANQADWPTVTGWIRYVRVEMLGERVRQLHGPVSDQVSLRPVPPHVACASRTSLTRCTT
jgi:hypothetical protein